MSFNPVSLGAAQLVAAALGRSIGVRVEVSNSAHTACVSEDPKTGDRVIYLPVLPVDVDAELSTLLWGFIHHEAGHSRHTDLQLASEPELAADSFLLFLFQALEDVRMESAHIALYPGAHRVLNDLITLLVNIGFFGAPDSKDAVHNAFQAFVLYFLRSTVLKQSALSTFSSVARRCLEQHLGAGIVVRLIAELQPIRTASSTSDALSLAFRVRDFLKEEMEKQKDNPPPPADAQSGDTDSSEYTDSSSPSTSDDTEGRADDNSQQSSSASNGADNDDSTEAISSLLAGGDIDESLGDLGDALSQTISDQIQSDPQHKVALPKTESTDVAYRDDAAIRDARMVSTRLAVQLKRQLESFNDLVAEPTKRGKRLSRRHLSRVAFKDYRVFTNRERQPELNTAVVSLIDASSSMQSEDRIGLAIQSLLATGLALDTLKNVSHAVGAFPGRTNHERVALIKDFSETSTVVSSRFSQSPRGSTPMAEALLWAANKLVQCSEERRLIFVATDGYPNDSDSTRRIIAHLRKLGIEVHGLGIQVDDQQELFDSFSQVDNLASLPSSFLDLFRRVLKQSA